MKYDLNCPPAWLTAGRLWGLLKIEKASMFFPHSRTPLVRLNHVDTHHVRTVISGNEKALERTVAKGGWDLIDEDLADESPLCLKKVE